MTFEVVLKWVLQQIHWVYLGQFVEHDGYGQVGHKIPVDIQKGTVFYRRVKNWKNGSDEFQEFAYQKKTWEFLNLETDWQIITNA